MSRQPSRDFYMDHRTRCVIDFVINLLTGFCALACLASAAHIVAELLR